MSDESDEKSEPKCDRKGCGKSLQDGDWYNVATGHWQKFGRQGEVRLCGACMADDPKYAASLMGKMMG